MSEHSHTPACIHCGERDGMVLESSSLTGSKWHCRNCLSKTDDLNWFGRYGRYLLMPALVFLGGGIHHHSDYDS